MCSSCCTPRLLQSLQALVCSLRDSGPRTLQTCPDPKSILFSEAANPPKNPISALSLPVSPLLQRVELQGSHRAGHCKVAHEEGLVSQRFGAIASWATFGGGVDDLPSEGRPIFGPSRFGPTLFVRILHTRPTNRTNHFIPLKFPHRRSLRPFGRLHVHIVIASQELHHVVGEMGSLRVGKDVVRATAQLLGAAGTGWLHLGRTSSKPCPPNQRPRFTGLYFQGLVLTGSFTAGPRKTGPFEVEGWILQSFLCLTKKVLRCSKQHESHKRPKETNVLTCPDPNLLEPGSDKHPI